MSLPVFLTDGVGNIIDVDNPSYSSPVVTNTNPTHDAFGRYRVSQTTQLFDSKLLNDNHPLQWDEEEVSGSGTGTTYNANRASVTMDVTANTAGKRVRQTFQRFNYQPAKSHLCLCTFVLGDTSTGLTKEVGYLDDNDGIGLQSKDGVVSLIIRSNVSGSVVDTVINQADWNVDKLDGAGPSGYNVDFTKAQILYIDFEWLGVGRVRAGFVIDGKIIYVHGFNHANIISNVYMSSPNLPIRYSIENSGSGAASQIECICASVATEGGRDQLGVPRAVSTGTTQSLSGTTNTYMLKAIRAQSGKDPSTVRLSDFQAFCASSDTILVSFIYNPTVNDAGNLSWAAVPSSLVEHTTGNGNHTVNLTGAIILYEYFQYGRQERAIPIADVAALTTAIDGTRGELAVCAKAISTNPSVGASVGWREI